MALFKKSQGPGSSVLFSLCLKASPLPPDQGDVQYPSYWQKQSNSKWPIYMQTYVNIIHQVCPKQSDSRRSNKFLFPYFSQQVSAFLLWPGHAHVWSTSFPDPSDAQDRFP